MDRGLFQKFCALTYEKAGITLKEGKEALVEARVGKRLRCLGLTSHREYLDFLDQDDSGDELVAFLDAISTNFTSFFRERDHFDDLTSRMKSWLEDGQQRFRLWSAASSSGEEPYTIAITILDLLERADADFKILATDISTRVLDHATCGVYDAGRVAPLSPLQKTKYFERSGRKQDDATTYAVKPGVKAHLSFKRMNLAKPPYPMKGPLDCVFCRNVMIYFDLTVRQRLISEVDRLLRPDGVLYIGHSETLTGIHSGLRCVRPSVYVKPA